MEELIGSLLQGRYRIEALLGRQTGRRTFLAIDTQTNDSVVVKLLLFGPDFTWDDLKLFEREAGVLKSLDYSAIPKYLDFFEVELEWGKGFALIQSYIAAQSLQQWVQGGRTFSEADLKALARYLLQILEYLHSRQPAVVHRDIKPSNILLTDGTAQSPGRVYLVDFGSVQTAIKGGTRTIVGTYGYMPPEQFGGITTPAADIYALGVTLIYLASGCSPEDLPQQDLRLHFEDRVHLSPCFVRWLQQAIAPSLEKRLQSARQAIECLDEDFNAPWVEVGNSARPHYQSLLTIEKPFGSKVVLQKFHNGLEILIPPRGFHWELIPKIVLAVIWNFYTGFWFNSLFFLGGWFLLLFRLAYLGVGLSLLFVVVFALFGRTRLRLTASNIALSHELFHVLWWTVKKAKVKHIVKLELAQVSFRKNAKGADVVVAPQINIWAGTQQIAIGGSHRLAQPELEWLSYHLGDWLKIPVVVITSTPAGSSEVVVWREPR